MMTVREKIAAGMYYTEMPYRYEMVPIDEDNMTVREAREHTDRQKEASRTHAARRREDIYRLEQIFRKDIAEETGLINHAKEPKVWDMAWAHRDSGLECVASYYEELAELVL